ncbi:bromodomain containing isoform cra_b, partial [Lynx pardinus]
MSTSNPLPWCLGCEAEERLLALKHSMSFMQDMDFSQQADLLGNEDTAFEELVLEAAPVQVETAKKSKR